MKVDYGEIIFQSTEGITEDQGTVQILRIDPLRIGRFLPGSGLLRTSASSPS